MYGSGEYFDVWLVVKCDINIIFLMKECYVMLFVICYGCGDCEIGSIIFFIKIVFDVVWIYLWGNDMKG